MPTLSFPADYKGGVSFALDGQQTVVPARGDVEVPDGAEVLLTLSRDVDLSFLVASQDMEVLKAQQERMQEAMNTAPPIDLSPLAHLPAGVVTGLALQMGHVTDDDVDHIAGLTSLKHLTLGACTLGPAATAKLGNLTGLTQLSASFTPLETHHCELLRSLPALEELELFGANDEACAALSEVKTLTRLSLMACHASDVGLRDIARISSLAHLRIVGAVTAAGMRALVELPSLESLDVYVAGCTTEVAELFVEYPHPLKQLELRGLEVPPALDVAIRRAHPNVTCQGISYGPRAVAKLAARLG